jgi:hypothetical protein
MPERQRYYNPMMQYVEETRPKPNEGYQDRIKKAQKVNAIAQVLNLVTQGAAASKGGTVLPTNDKVTPFAMSEFQKMREQEIAQGEHDRKYGLQALTKQLDYGVQEQRRGDDRSFQLDKEGRAQENKERWRTEDWERKRETDDKFRMTPEETVVLEKLKSAIQADRQKDIMKYANELKILEERRKEERDQNKPATGTFKPIFYIDQKYPVTELELNSLSDKVMGMIKENPEVLERLRTRLPVGPIAALRMGEGPRTGKISAKDWQIILTELKDEIAPHYNELIGNTRGDKKTMTYMGGEQPQQAVGTGQPPNQYQSTTGSGMLARPAQPEKKQDEGSPLDKIFNDKQKRDPVFTENYNKVINQIMTAFDAPDYSYSQKIQLIEAAFKSIGMNDDQVSQMKNLLLR